VSTRLMVSFLQEHPRVRLAAQALTSDSMVCKWPVAPGLAALQYHSKLAI
jgi:hypothetical protein